MYLCRISPLPKQPEIRRKSKRLERDALRNSLLKNDKFATAKRCCKSDVTLFGYEEACVHFAYKKNATSIAHRLSVPSQPHSITHSSTVRMNERNALHCNALCHYCVAFEDKHRPKASQPSQLSEKLVREKERERQRTREE